MKFNVLLSLDIVASLGALLVAGFLFAFSTMIMRSLDHIDAPTAIEAMRSINLVAVRSLLMPLMFGTALLALAVGVGSVGAHTVAGKWYLVAGALLYLLGVIGVTMLCNVPLNNQLANADLSATRPVVVWAAYSPGWTVWNHLRTLAALLSGLAFARGATLL